MGTKTQVAAKIEQEESPASCEAELVGGESRDALSADRWKASAAWGKARWVPLLSLLLSAPQPFVGRLDCLTEVSMAKKGLKHDSASVRQREKQAVELRNAGLSYQEIAERLGLAGIDTARKIILRCYERDIVTDVEEIRQRELTKLDALEQAVYAKARNGDEKAIETLLKLMKERRKYVGGLEVPKEIKVEEISDPTKEIVAYLEGIAERANAEA